MTFKIFKRKIQQQKKTVNRKSELETYNKIKKK